MRRAQLADWLEDVIEYGPEAVSRACGRWRVTQNRRPTPADIVKLAIEERDLLADPETAMSPGKKSYKAMTDAEKQVFHTGVYAFRQAHLGKSPDDHTSPCDPRGDWYRVDLIEDEVRRLRPAQRGRDDVTEGRAIANAWARNRGHNDIDAYAEAKGVHWSDAYRECIADIFKGSPLAQGMRGALNAADLGVTAREYAPTPEQLRQGRVALGLEAGLDG